jgi:proton glutamate symport protein
VVIARWRGHVGNSAAVKSPAIRALVGLALGLAVGVFIVATGSDAGRAFATAVQPVGTIWVNGLRMTIVPLVVSLLISTIASGGGGATVGRVGWRAFGVYIGLAVAIGVLGLLLAPPVYALLDVDPASAASLRAAAAAAPPAATPPSFATWLVGVVPTNVVRSASDAAMLQLVLFAVLFGLALGRLDLERREPVVAFFRGLADAMLVVVRWVLLAAPVGAFALSLTVATHLGAASAYFAAFYIVSHAALLVVVGALLYLLIPLLAGVPLARFARALLPAQIIVVATRSSLAAFPATLDGAERVLQVPSTVARFVLPLGISFSRANTALSWVVGALFLGALYGVPLSFAQLAGAAVVAVAMSFSVPGIPSGGLLIATPYFVSLGLPPEGIGILIALDAIPDIFKTGVIVTCHMSAAVLLARSPRAVMTPAGATRQ